ncbi:pyridoxamine 5'-phosphate oxidase [Aeromicrobium wangtongii]|uniref:Pyridoxine/pyridoxamine 5'-phosphate oxidase n=1 Tax=Aeromicrobium wangtongii TaxID=2969247 RepID=A0ABY5MB35_9ACTN|nr:pyridoxamine 5'-phosphate oxidase [Aeromicrobium wangtongii]MCD9196788.1 pyridoxamine 5'-phosphate oxidase [Aeromicrobium wangtongii]UUP14298.1 pyridoxamine 5'-phosphate oxidase [Aeromicrobium wangtongii]
MESPDLARMRSEYAHDGLDEQAAGDDPLVLFDRWFDDAVTAGVHEPNAMALATATPQGRPSSRIVLLKGLDDRGLVFFSGYESRKGRELSANPWAAATMLWHPLQRQVRIEGSVTRIPEEESDAYFAVRPRGAQIGAVASPQSQPIADRRTLDQRVADVEQACAGRDIERPAVWGGFRIAVDSIEFWQGRDSRLHDRLLFTRAPGGWTRERLAP